MFYGILLCNSQSDSLYLQVNTGVWNIITLEKLLHWTSPSINITLKKGKQRLRIAPREKRIRSWLVENIF